PARGGNVGSWRPRVMSPRPFCFSVTGGKQRDECRGVGASRSGYARALARETVSSIDTDASHPVGLKDFFSPSGRRPAPMGKLVYFFGSGKAEGSSLMRNLLGGKGCELAEMTNLGIPVPPGFTITTEAWAEYNRRDRRLPDGLGEEVLTNLGKLQTAAGLSFGDPKRPLLVSVRSGARISMPGMMETIL